ncbi:hypothetical protein ALQ94_101189 [Pseudomonas amygdali pv. morsprunorum]|uniref:SMI1/KNR4 family protein n=3 Tax=Pseudomonas syringae group TaxID=136849 RepID=A0A3M2X3T9_PSEA0|nr:hypothetical protein ALQ94_101189 [Pseudomonas amygdali pv. morsprunorum]
MRIKIMISTKLIAFFKQQGWWYEEASADYEVELGKLGIDLSSDFAQFYLHVEDGPTFMQHGKEIYQICWFSKNTNFDLGLKRTHETLELPQEYIPLDGFEGESGYFYNRNTGEVLCVSLVDELAELKQGNFKPQWANFNDFLEHYFDRA